MVTSSALAQGPGSNPGSEPPTLKTTSSREDALHSLSPQHFVDQENNSHGFLFSFLWDGKELKGLKISYNADFLFMANTNHCTAQRFKGRLFLPELILWTLQLLCELNRFFLDSFFNTQSTFHTKACKLRAACSPELKSLAHSSLQL